MYLILFQHILIYRVVFSAVQFIRKQKGRILDIKINVSLIVECHDRCQQRLILTGILVRQHNTFSIWSMWTPFKCLQMFCVPNENWLKETPNRKLKAFMFQGYNIHNYSENQRRTYFNLSTSCIKKLNHGEFFLKRFQLMFCKLNWW